MKQVPSTTVPTNACLDRITIVKHTAPFRADCTGLEPYFHSCGWVTYNHERAACRHHTAFQALPNDESDQHA